MKRTARVGRLALLMALALPLGAKAQSTTALTPTQVERLAGLAKVWGAIKFFHPYLVEQHIDWDSALVETIPKVESATSAEEYRQAIEYLLSFLHDPGSAQ